MTAKRVLFRSEAREKVLHGAAQLADAVRITLGPKSKSVLIQKKWGAPVVCNDGVTIAKEMELEDVQRRFPAEHYVFVDDKLRLLDAIKTAWGSRVTTVFPRQGHYARDPEVLRSYPPADVTVDRIGDLLDIDLSPKALARTR